MLAACILRPERDLLTIQPNEEVNAEVSAEIGP
jgi:hypothetical protein